MGRTPKRQNDQNPRTKRVREIVMTEGAKILVEEGGEAVTALRIAERTGVSRSAVYRHWPNQTALLLDVVEWMVAPHQGTELTGDVERDLQTALTNLGTRLNIRPFRQVFAALLSQASRDDAFAEPQQRFVNGVLQQVREVLLDAMARGKLPPKLGVERACAQLAGPLLVQHVMLRVPIENALVVEVVRGFLSTHSPSLREGRDRTRT